FHCLVNVLVPVDEPPLGHHPKSHLMVGGTRCHQRVDVSRSYGPATARFWPRTERDPAPTRRGPPDHFETCHSTSPGQVEPPTAPASSRVPQLGRQLEDAYCQHRLKTDPLSPLQ